LAVGGSGGAAPFFFRSRGVVSGSTQLFTPAKKNQPIFYFRNHNTSMSGIMPGRLVEALDKMHIKKGQQAEAAPPAAAVTAEHAAPPASASSPTPVTAAAGATRAAALVTVPGNVDRGQSMSACRWRGKKHVAVADDIPVPLVTDATDAILRVGIAAICGSDLHLYNGSMAGMKSGDTIGHECMGVVESVGPGVKKIKPGDRVSMAFDFACGACWFCERELFTSCDITNPSATQHAMYGGRTSGAAGYSHMTGGWSGCHADFVRVPFADVNLLPLAEVEEEAAKEMEEEEDKAKAYKNTKKPTITDAQAALLGDVLPTAWTATSLGGVEKGSFVVVFGAGPIGLVAAQCAAHRGARRIILVDPIQDRLDLARKPGVVLRDGQRCRLDTVKVSGSGSEQALKDVAALCEGEPAGAPDVAIEAVGQHYALSAVHALEMAVAAETDSPEAFNACLRAVRKGGRVAVVGVFAGLANHVHLGALMEKGLTVSGSQAPVQRYWRMLAKKVAKGELDPAAVVTHVVPLAEAPRAFALFDGKTDGCVKVLLQVGGSAGAAAAGVTTAAEQEVAAVAVT
jgi:threonine dehydrogenase-like Zn-dependent dehydrogenase